MADIAQLFEDIRVGIAELRQHRDVASWVRIGVGFGGLQTEAMHRAGTNDTRSSRYRRAYAELMAQAPDLAKFEKEDRAGCYYAVWLSKNWDAVQVWLKAGEPRSLRWNHPTGIYYKFTGTEPKRMKRGGMDQRTYQKILARLETLEDEEGKALAVVFRGLESILVRESPQVDLVALGIL
jgi:hypothetical protein